MKKPKYLHTEIIHNLSAPKLIVPEITRLLNPKGVVDIGCGTGTFLYCFKQEGVKEVLGVDGNWVDKQLLYKYLEPNEFIEHDLEKPLKLGHQFDLAISLEVGEHLSPKSADIFVANLVSAGKIILFSAAIPLQGGQNHLNEQWLDYWGEKFLRHDYVIHDVLRPIFWDNPNIFWWYRQNMVLVAHRNFKFEKPVKYNHLTNVVHSVHYLDKADRLNNLMNGELGIDTYIKLLIKSIVGNKNVKRIKKLF